MMTGQSHEFVELTENDLMEGDVTIAVSHSTLNYKDGLALDRRLACGARLADDTGH